jgi:hypothetical protein
MTYDFTAKLQTLDAERRAIKAEQQRLERQQQEKESRSKVSKASLNKWIAKEVQRRITLGGISPQLVAAYLETASNPESLLWDLVQKALNSPVYGFELTSEGFRFNGLDMDSVQDLSKAINKLLGDYGPYNGPDFLEALIYANVTGEEYPVSHAIANINTFPTDLEPPEANRLYDLTGYHHKLGSLMPSTPQRPDLSTVAPVVADSSGQTSEAA